MTVERDSVAPSLSSLAVSLGSTPRSTTSRRDSGELQALADSLGVDVRDYGNAIEHDPRALDDVLAGSRRLAGLKKKYGPDLESVRLARDDAASRLAAESRGSALEQAERASKPPRPSCANGARNSTGPEGAPGFVSAFQTATSRDLAMSGARFEVAFADVPFESWGPKAPRSSSSTLPHPRSPLDRSRGGVGRRDLARHARAQERPRRGGHHPLVFDEIDAGIGGSTATAVGRRLAELARTHQVLVVTHLAQVAAFAERSPRRDQPRPRRRRVATRVPGVR